MNRAMLCTGTRLKQFPMQPQSDVALAPELGKSGGTPNVFRPLGLVLGCAGATPNTIGSKALVLGSAVVTQTPLGWQVQLAFQT